MNRLAMIGIGGLLAAALLIAACSQQAAPSQPSGQAQGAPSASAGGGAATSDADLIGSPTQPSEPGDPSLLGNDTGADTPLTS